MSTTMTLDRHFATPLALSGALLSFACASEPSSTATSDAPTTDTGDVASTSTTTADPTTATTGNPADASTSTSPGESSDGGPSTSDADGSTTAPAEPGPDLRERGPHEVTTTPGQHSANGCNLVYDVFAPTGVARPPRVILAHGFQGTRASMVGWAEHWASWGIEVITPNLCHSTIIDADHAQNGADLVALAEHLGGADIGFAGYSAGGLAAVIATAARPTTPVLLGLDMVDSGGLGAEAAPSVAAPALGITAETAMCNSSSNGVPVFGAMPDHHIVRLVEADHCDFQNPGDGFCGLCSSPNDAIDPETIAATIRGMSTAALLWQLGVDPSGAQWWTPGGPYYDTLFGDGLLVGL